jgi:putative transposase
MPVGQLGRQLVYKAGWYGTTLVVAPRFFASSKTCSHCGRIDQRLGLGDRVFRCHTGDGGCGLVIDRDRNAAVNLAAWAEAHHQRDCGGDAQVPDPQAAGRVTNACGGISAGHRTRGGGETAPQPQPVTGAARSRNRTRPPAGGREWTPEKGAVE